MIAERSCGRLSESQFQNDTVRPDFHNRATECHGSPQIRLGAGPIWIENHRIADAEIRHIIGFVLAERQNHITDVSLMILRRFNQRHGSIDVSTLELFDETELPRGSESGSSFGIVSGFRHAVLQIGKGQHTAEITQRQIVAGMKRLQQHQEEEDTASMIARKLHERIPVLTIEKELEEAQEDLNITLSEQQKEAVRMVFANPISIITGGPGTGKTTVLKIILYIYQKKCGNEVKLMAPTGRAARRMAESTGSGDATTMHMALGLFGDGDYEALIDELSADFINVDEVSMVDMHLAYEFFYKVKAGARVLLVGDVHQLPSVGAGDVFRQLILCGKIPVTVLNLVYRQGKDSNIPINAQLINEGKTNLQWGDDFQMVECSGADAAAQIVKNIYLKEIQMYGMEQVQILSPYKVRSAEIGRAHV